MSQKPAPIIVIDSREYSQEKDRIVAYLARRGTRISVRLLETGDYFVEGNPRSFLIERSRLTDLLNKVRSGRLWEQLRRMKHLEEGVQPILLVERNLGLVRETKWNPESVIGILESILVDWEIPMLQSPNRTWTAMMLHRITNFTEQSAELHKVNFDKTPKNMDQARIFLLEGLPLVGPKKARALLSQFGTLGGIFAASQADLHSVKGISEKMAETLYKLITEPWTPDNHEKEKE